MWDHYKYVHCKRWFVILTIACHQNYNCDMVLSNDARLVSCDSHLWAMQGTWSAARIEIHPYKDPCHCENWLVTLTTLWLPWVYFSIRDGLLKSPARQLAQITTLTILWTSTRSPQLCCHGNFHALDGKRCLPHSCLVKKVCQWEGHCCQMFALSHLSIKSSTLSLANSLDRFWP